MGRSGRHESHAMRRNSLSSAVPPVKDWHKSVCRPGATGGVPAFRAYVSAQSSSGYSPIDQFLAATEALTMRGKPAFFDDFPELRGLLIAALASQTENYFRELFSRLLVVCPVSQVKASHRDMKLGSAIWHRAGQLERGAFEHFSFASSDNITDTLNRYFEIKVDERSDPFPLLQQFDTLCEIRHAVVHSAGIFSGKNAMKLQMGRSSATMHVDVDFQRFQEATSLCTALVCSMNAELFRKFAERWRDRWPNCTAGWNDSVARDRFKKLWTIFSSVRDQEAGLAPRQMTATQCRREILSP